jgi:hypothetical protein
MEHTPRGKRPSCGPREKQRKHPWTCLSPLAFSELESPICGPVRVAEFPRDEISDRTHKICQSSDTSPAKELWSTSFERMDSFSSHWYRYRVEPFPKSEFQIHFSHQSAFFSFDSFLHFGIRAARRIWFHFGKHRMSRKIRSATAFLEHMHRLWIPASRAVTKTAQPMLSSTGNKSSDVHSISNPTHTEQQL